MKGNWFKLHRELQNHWVAERLDWYAGWVDILASVDYRTGRVCLTDVPARDKFEKSAWRHFIRKLVDDGMLTEPETVRQGEGKGTRQYAQVVNWAAYNHTENGENNDTPSDTPSALEATPEQPVQDVITTGSAHQQQHTQHAGNDALYKETKKTSKEIKEPPPPLGEKSVENLLEAKFGAELLETLLNERPERKRWFALTREQVANATQSANNEAGAFRTRLKEHLDEHAGLAALQKTRFSARRESSPPPETTIGAGYDFTNFDGGCS